VRGRTYASRHVWKKIGREHFFLCWSPSSLVAWSQGETLKFALTTYAKCRAAFLDPPHTFHQKKAFFDIRATCGVPTAIKGWGTWLGKNGPLSSCPPNGIARRDSDIPIMEVRNRSHCELPGFDSVHVLIYPGQLSIDFSDEHEQKLVATCICTSGTRMNVVLHCTDDDATLNRGWHFRAWSSMK